MNGYFKAFFRKEQLEDVINGDTSAPREILGAHLVDGIQWIISYRPCAVRMFITNSKGNQKNEMICIDPRGVFGIILEKNHYKSYLFEVEYDKEDIVVVADPYGFPLTISSFDCYLYGEGKHYKIFDKLGAHPEVCKGVAGTRFAVWAPNARAVSVIGDFNTWDGRMYPMTLHGSTGFFELFIPDVGNGMAYKYQITTLEGKKLFKTDPYGNYAEVRPSNASRIFDINQYHWKDKKYSNGHRKGKRDFSRLPMNIYEVHLGSWKKIEDGRNDGFLTYREIAHELGEYLMDMHYTHVELMGIAEYPYDGSWGYQVGCYYAPTSRYGDPEDFMYFVEYMHKLGIQVILDWVPAHFPKDEHGLGNFDGKPVYEHPDKRRGEHPEWGTYIFNYGKNEVANFLLANALFWIEKYHIDGLRMDAVASMLYLDYGKKQGEWCPNQDGGNENYEAVAFLRHLNEVVEQEYPGAYIIAEESTSWLGVTAPVGYQGLGFNFKWNMGWMNDFTEYMKLDPYFKAHHHDQLCYSLSYHLSEQYILVLSHDEVVHGKCSMINKMPGLEGDKFANLKAAYGFFYGHPGKKLLFMGQEFAQLREWSEERSLDWELLKEKSHRGIQKFIQDMNVLYKENDALYYNDNDIMGFEWMDCQSWEKSTLAFVRRGSSQRKQLMFLLNFTTVPHEEYYVKAPCGGSYVEVMNSDNKKYGGEGRVNSSSLEAYQNEEGQWALTVCLPPCSVVVLQYDYE